MHLLEKQIDVYQMKFNATALTAVYLLLMLLFFNHFSTSSYQKVGLF